MFNTNFTSKSKSNSQDVDYQLFLKDEKIRLSRLLFFLGFVLYGAFLVVDYWALPSAFDTSVVIRLAAITLMLLAYATTYHSKFIKYYGIILSANFIVAVAGVESMIFLAIPSDHAYTSYFAGLMIVMIALYSWTHLRLCITSALSIMSILIYVGIEIYVRDMVNNDRTPTIVSNLFFLGSAVVFGFLAQVQRDRYLRENFLLQISLKKAYKEKAAEAKDHQYLANHDALTGLPNRRYMIELLEDSIKIAAEKDKLLVIMFLDLNGFKQVNDVYGHAAGDKVLKVVAKRLELAVRSEDHVSRLGGDEYLIGLMMDKNQLDETELLTHKFSAIIAQSMNIEGIRVSVGTSIGIAAYPIHGNQVSVLIDIADKRMYEAKKEKTPVSLETINEKQEDKITVFRGAKA